MVLKNNVGKTLFTAVQMVLKNNVGQNFIYCCSNGTLEQRGYKTLFTADLMVL